MNRQEALKRISALSCGYQNKRMTECPHCAAEVEFLIKILTRERENVGPEPKGKDPGKTIGRADGLDSA